jgi:Rieske Fe-S protein
MKQPPDLSRRKVITWLWRLPVIAVILGASYAFFEGYRIEFRKERPRRNPTFADRPAQEIISLNALKNPWDSEEFSFAGIPAIVMRTPERVAGGFSFENIHVLAVSRICTHQGCIVNFNKNPEALAVAFNYRSDQPALACHCHFSVFAPGKAAQAVSGPATKPLPRIRLELREGVLYATGLEA